MLLILLYYALELLKWLIIARALLSWFGKVDYNFANRYYLSGTLRYDGSSRLGEAYRWGTFPAFSAGWRVSEEAFMANSPFSDLRLRAGRCKGAAKNDEDRAAERIRSHHAGSSFL